MCDIFNLGIITTEAVVKMKIIISISLKVKIWRTEFMYS